MSAPLPPTTDIANTAADMDAVIRSLGPDALWQAGEPLPSEEVEELLTQIPATRRNLPADMRELYRHAGDSYIGDNIFLIPVDEVVDKYEGTYGEFLDEDMPSLFLFAVDNGSNAYFCDTDDSLQHGTGAVYKCSLSSLLPRDCVLCAPSVTEFLRLSTAGLKPWKSVPSLGRQQG